MGRLWGNVEEVVAAAGQDCRGGARVLRESRRPGSRHAGVLDMLVRRRERPPLAAGPQPPGSRNPPTLPGPAPQGGKLVGALVAAAAEPGTQSYARGSHVECRPEGRGWLSRIQTLPSLRLCGRAFRPVLRSTQVVLFSPMTLPNTCF